jgi:hypothetical protein
MAAARAGRSARLPLDLDVFAHELPTAIIQVCRNGFALGLEAKT